MFSCDLDQNSMQALSLPGTAFSGLSVKATGLRVEAEMYQCVEKVSSETKKDAVGGGKTTVKTYTYSREWKSTYVNSGSFEKKTSDNFKTNCGVGVENPQWPSYVPKSETKYSAAGKADAWSLSTGLIDDVPLTKDYVSFAAPSGWTKAGVYYENTQSMTTNQIGKVRLKLKTNDWASPKVTVLGKNDQGTINKWTASDSWLCSGFTLSDLRMGTVNKDTLFESLKAESSALTWILRFIGFLVLWGAFASCAGPLEVVADCIPCIGPYLGDAVEMIACVVCCCPACACCMGVAGVVWVAMRPMVGIPLMFTFFATAVGMVAFKIYSQQQKSARTIEDGEVVGNPMEHE